VIGIGFNVLKPTFFISFYSATIKTKGRLQKVILTLLKIMTYSTEKALTGEQALNLNFQT